MRTKWLAKVGVILLQQDCGIKKTWILLDTCFTNSVSNNREMVGDIQKCDPHDTLTAHTNRRVKVFGKYATLRIMPIRTHFNKDSLAMILALKDIASIPGTKVTMDTSLEQAILVTMADGTIFKFVECASGLYFVDTENFNRKTKITTMLTPTLYYK